MIKKLITSKILTSRIFILLAIATHTDSFGAVRPERTREIITLGDEIRIPIINSSDDEYLVQVWVEDEKGSVENIPIITSPPIVKIKGGEKRYIKTISIPQSLPDDREFVYYFVTQEIPKKQTGKKNELSITVKTRIKLIVRPTTIPETYDQRELLKNVNAVLEENSILMSNPSPYNITLGYLTVSSNKNGDEMTISSFEMIPPFGETRYFLPENIDSDVIILRFGLINDWGSVSDLEVRKLR